MPDSGNNLELSRKIKELVAVCSPNSNRFRLLLKVQFALWGLV